MIRMKLMSLPLMLLPCLAGATDSGETLFNKACSHCHTARRPEKEAKAQPTLARDSKAIPTMDLAIQNRSAEQLRTWVQAPHKVNAKTGCDTRQLRAEDMDALMGYLSTLAVPLELPRDEMLRQQLQEKLKAQRARQQANTHQPNSSPGGK
ncbi:cytochrome c [Corallococcus sp. M34]|uniref:c-type cytochrome n=1 Tax=Citreicoccus inhibens TaxID=2849499 RepID=UPI00131566AB|nr:c-type cytochrome [Citreicoccus inhibens]MBU8896355.1 cytochrome c [Citreicoccus inhibens]